MSLDPESKGASTGFERIIDFLKQFRGEQFVAFCKSCLEKPEDPRQSQPQLYFMFALNFFLSGITPHS